jgi:TATA-binding protein-associated factor Taf7
MNTPTNISINPADPLPANGTVSISTEGVTDTDMNVIPPEGITVIISNDTVTVTNQAVDIAAAEEDEDEAGTEEEEEPEDETEDETEEVDTE